MCFIEGARNWRPIAGTQICCWPLNQVAFCHYRAEWGGGGGALYGDDFAEDHFVGREDEVP